MRSSRKTTVLLVTLLTAGVLVLSSSAAHALDGYQDRKGPFAGFGVGGGAAVMGGEVGGEFMFDGQIGGGATRWLTFALDLDARLQMINEETNWAVVPGPEVNIFLGGNFFIRIGVGLGFIMPENDDTISKDFTFAFNGNLGIGYEFFMTSNVALDLAIESDYFAIDNLDDLVTFGFTMGLRFY